MRYVAINPSDGKVLCKDNKFRTKPLQGTGPRCIKLYKTIGGASRASERLGHPLKEFGGLELVSSSTSLDNFIKFGF